LVGLALATHETGHAVGLVLASVDTVLINFTDVDLDGGVLLGRKDTGSVGALARDVGVDDATILVGHTSLGDNLKSHGFYKFNFWLI